MSQKDHNHDTCEKMLSSLGEYIDGTLGKDLCLEIEKHMQGCTRCRVVVNTLKKTVELYHGTAEEEEQLPVDVRQRLFARLSLEDFVK